MSELSHMDESGKARMVDVSGKAVTSRRAVAEGFVRCSSELVRAIRENGLKKGDLLGVAQLAGIMGAKKTGELIPMCHPLPIHHVAVSCEVIETGVRIEASVATEGKTGVEMEALTAVAVAALAVVDMGKAVDKAMVIEGVRVLEKTGGKTDINHREHR